MKNGLVNFALKLKIMQTEKLIQSLLEQVRQIIMYAAPRRVQDILEQGAARARAIAQRTMAEVHKKLGLWRSR